MLQQAATIWQVASVLTKEGGDSTGSDVALVDGVDDGPGRWSSSRLFVAAIGSPAESLATARRTRRSRVGDPSGKKKEHEEMDGFVCRVL